jgi:hypothetical protein
MIMEVLNELIFQRLQTFGQLNFSNWEVFQSLHRLLQDGVDSSLLVSLFLFYDMLQLLPQLHFRVSDPLLLISDQRKYPVLEKLPPLVTKGCAWEVFGGEASHRVDHLLRLRLMNGGQG